MGFRHVEGKVRGLDQGASSPSGLGRFVGLEGLVEGALRRGGCLVDSDIALVAATVEARWERAAGAMGHQAPWLGGHESRVPTAREPRRQEEGVRGEGNPRAEAPDDSGLA